ncbi:hypothetical protein [Flavobacterium sp.]|uniref:hypothetical protein n=1 Tax=Flavobacterium sp. TaxID=239 RepID=UPI0037527938
MNYSIGEIVKYDERKSENFIILATKNEPLTENFLKLKQGKYKIENFNEIAKEEVLVSKGYDYTIAKIVNTANENFVIENKFINVCEINIEY